MKPRGRHPENALSAVKVRSISEPGKYADGNGLYLVVDPSGAKRWMLRTVVMGRRSDIGLGGLSLVSLSEAREMARTYRKIAREGGNPIAERNRQKRVIPTFREAAETVHAAHKPSWKNGKHASQWMNSLRDHVFPRIGERRVDSIETPQVIEVLSSIWLEKPETARRVRQRIRMVLDWAKASGFREGDNPVDQVGRVLPRQPSRDGHFSALPYMEVPGLIGKLRVSEFVPSVRLGLEFLILTATRTSEVMKARWEEVDKENAVWTIPGDRMKSGRPHIVPLSDRCLEILEASWQGADSPYVFSGRKKDQPLSNMAFLMTLRRLGVEATVHGFRSSFRDWAAEQTNFPRDVCEAVLAHAVKDKTEAAYRRSDLLAKRRQLMDTWSSFAEPGD